jgi:small GTP-binding protein
LQPLLDAALEDRDVERLQAALTALSSAAPLPASATGGALEGEIADAQKLALALGETADTAKLDRLAAIVHPRALPWARELRDQLLDAWIPAIPASGATVEAASARWPALLARLDTQARTLHDLGASADLATLAALGSQPIRLAIVGEFNAGKSTFINALLGADVAPTGVLPTTATLHHLRYAQDPIARIHLGTSAGKTVERIVPLGELRAVLKTMAQAETSTDAVDRVDILAPLPFLTRVEILDTPGFNAPDARHAEAARRAFAEADVIVWLLDGAQAMKASERAILDEARRAGLPIQFLVNKADRLTPADLGKVMDLVTTALADAGLRSWSPPLPLSARLALAGKLGDEAALTASRWSEVQALFDNELVARSDELKERALRRRARAIVARLVTRATERAHAEASARETALHAHGACLLAAAALDRDAGSTVRDVADAIAAASAGARCASARSMR